MNNQKERLFLKGVAGVLISLVLISCSGGETGDSHPGEDTYNQSCFSCHASGVAGAPIPGDAAAWSPRLIKSREMLLQSVKDGMPPGMPAMGMCMSCSDDDLKSAIDYMLTR